MNKEFRIPDEIRFNAEPDSDAHAAERALKNFRYVVSAVNADAQKAWADLWEELKTGVTPAGVVSPTMQQGFKPSCGWAEFLEKFWLLKHYLDYVNRYCQESSGV
jgi:hypothetical protein